MKARITLAAIVAAAIGAVAVPTAAYAGPNDNNNATVAGVAGVNPYPGVCDVGRFCLFTGPNFTGKVFPLIRCTTYAIHNWNGVGSWANNNSGGKHALLLDRNGYKIIETVPGDSNVRYNFKPVWYVNAC